MKDINLKEQERIIDEVRQNGLIFVWRYMVGIIFIVSAAFFMFWFFQHGTWGQIAFALLLFLGFFVISRTWFLWKHNVSYITTHRVIDVEQRGMFSRVISEIPYDQIEDVVGTKKGIWQTVFRYGTVTIQTGNGKVKIILPHVTRPIQLQQQINEMRERYISKYSHDFSGDVAGVIIDKLYELELADLTRVKKVLDKRMIKLDSEKIND